MTAAQAGEVIVSEVSLPELPVAALWMTGESKCRLKNFGGNSKGAVPAHGKRSAAANLPLFTVDQLLAYGQKCAISCNANDQLVEALQLAVANIGPGLRRELDNNSHKNPGSTDCGYSILITPKAWQAINAALAAAGVKP